MSQTLKTSLEKIPFENVCKCSVTTDMLNSLISWIKGVACSNNASTWSTFVPCYWLIGASASNKSRGIAWIDLSWPIENRIECNSSLELAPTIEGAVGAIKICIGRLYRVSGSWHSFSRQIGNNLRGLDRAITQVINLQSSTVRLLTKRVITRTVN